MIIKLKRQYIQVLLKNKEDKKKYKNNYKIDKNYNGYCKIQRDYRVLN